MAGSGLFQAGSADTQTSATITELRVEDVSAAVTFILGGAASGKSAFAESLCFSSGKPKAYWATSQIFDDEMREKVAKHLAQRGADWTTHEEPFDAAKALGALAEGQICLIDCATMWLTNHLLAGHDLAAEQDGLLAAVERCRADLVIVPNETGLGIVPENKLARRFPEAQGRLNTALAAPGGPAAQATGRPPLVLKAELSSPGRA